MVLLLKHRMSLILVKYLGMTSYLQLRKSSARKDYDIKWGEACQTNLDSNSTFWAMDVTLSKSFNLSLPHPPPLKHGILPALCLVSYTTQLSCMQHCFRPRHLIATAL